MLIWDLEFVIWDFGHIALGNDELKYEPESPYYLCHWYSIPLWIRGLWRRAAADVSILIRNWKGFPLFGYQVRHSDFQGHYQD